MAAFVALVRRLTPVLLGDSVDPEPSDRSWDAPGPRIPLALALAVTAVAGFAAGPLATLLTDAARVLSVTP
jgi:hypothetical protein